MNTAKIGILTISDRASRGVYQDLGGPAIAAWLTQALTSPWQAVARVIPDEQREIEAALRELRAQNIPIVALETRAGAVIMGEYRWPSPVALVLGHEVVGVSDEVLALCDVNLRIPMYGVKNSLNVASAFAVVIYDLVAQGR